jgi:DNA gyrase subunit A
MLLLSEYGYGKRVDFSEFSAHGRGTGGQRIYTVSEKTGALVGCTNVREEEDLMCITVQGKSIKLKVSTIRVMGRSAQGVRILNIDEPDLVVGVDRIARGADSDAPEAESAAASVAPSEEPTLFGGTE